MFERTKPEEEPKPLRAVDAWAYRLLKSLSPEQRTVEAVAWYGGCARAEAVEILERLLKWRLVK